MTETATSSLLPAPRAGDILLAVCGAHMRGMALSAQMAQCGASFVAETRSAPDYRFYALPLVPPRPGMIRVSPGSGSTIAMELWSIAPEGLGRLMTMVDEPLGIGTVRLEDGRKVKGFICEAIAADGARDITALASWRAHVAATATA